jgi:hypothetical protein
LTTKSLVESAPPYDAVTVGFPVAPAEAEDWLIAFVVKVLLIAPARMGTLSGTVATSGAELDSAIFAPKGSGAGPLSLKAPVDGFPPVTGFGSKVSDSSFTLAGWEMVFSILPDEAAFASGAS